MIQAQSLEASLRCKNRIPSARKHSLNNRIAFGVPPCGEDRAMRQLAEAGGSGVRTTNGIHRNGVESLNWLPLPPSHFGLSFADIGSAVGHALSYVGPRVLVLVARLLGRVLGSTTPSGRIFSALTSATFLKKTCRGNPFRHMFSTSRRGSRGWRRLVPRGQKHFVGTRQHLRDDCGRTLAQNRLARGIRTVLRAHLQLHFGKLLGFGRTRERRHR